MTPKKAYRPRVCEICNRALECASTGRVRLTCGDRCRQIKRRRYDYAGWKDKRRREQAKRRAEKQICKWEKKLNLDFSMIPGDRFDPYAMSLRDRLMIHLPRGWPVYECWTCQRPYLPHDRRSYVCSDKCADKRHRYFKALRENFYSNPRRMPDEIYPYIRAGKRLGLCGHCGDPFVPHNVRRKYCSERCKDAAYWKRRPLRTCTECREKHRGSRKLCSRRCANVIYRRVTATCVRCERFIKRGSEVLPQADTHIPRLTKRTAVFCSAECRDRLGWIPADKVCKRCGEGFRASAQNIEQRSHYCSVRCRMQPNHVIHRQRWREQHPRLCRHCDQKLPVDRLGQGHRYCSEACKAEAAVMRKDKPIPVPVEWMRVKQGEVGVLVG